VNAPTEHVTSADGTKSPSAASAMDRPDDARAVLAIAGRRASVIGHSFGGAIALELARTAPPSAIRRLVLYEPGIKVAGLIPDDQVDRIERLVDEDRLEDALSGPSTPSGSTSRATRPSTSQPCCLWAPPARSASSATAKRSPTC
jgi:pimeloyl-ACP methyl ester carboxylesterase